MITATDSGSGGGMNSSRYLSVYVFFLVTFTPGCCASYSACWRFWRSRSSSCCQHRHQQVLLTQCIGVDPDLLPRPPNWDGNIDVNIHPKFLPVVCICTWYCDKMLYLPLPVKSEAYTITLVQGQVLIFFSTWARTPITKLTKDRRTINTDPVTGRPVWLDDCALAIETKTKSKHRYFLATQPWWVLKLYQFLWKYNQMYHIWYGYLLKIRTKQTDQIRIPHSTMVHTKPCFTY